MKQFKNILVVIRDNESIEDNAALTRSVELARRNNARLTLMDVVRPSDNVLNEFKGIVKVEQLAEMLTKKRQKALLEIAGQFNNDIDVQVKIAVGTDFIEIIRQILLAKHDLVIKVANKHSGSFDSSDFHLMRKCPVPVWLLNEQHQHTCKKILVAIDLAIENSEEGKAMNTFIMDLATSLAKWEKAEIHTLSCWSLYGENALRHSLFMRVSEDKVNQALLDEKQANQARLDNLLSRYKEHQIHPHLIKGDPVDHIPTFVKEKEIDVVVMGTVARSGIPGLLIGNTAEAVLQLINSSVITLKPRGFESPIR